MFFSRSFQCLLGSNMVQKGLVSPNPYPKVRSINPELQALHPALCSIGRGSTSLMKARKMQQLAGTS